MTGRSLARDLALAGALGSVGCAEPALADDDCPAWTRAEASRCVLRDWVRPGPDDGLGAPGARDIEVALGPEGQALLAWAHTGMADGHVVMAESDGEGWSTTEVRAGAGDGVEPAVALGPGGRALLAWKQQREEGTVYLATRDAKGTWSWPDEDRPLSWPQTAYEPRVHFGSDGEALVVWNQWTGTNFGVAVGWRDADDPDGALALPTTADQLLSPAVNFSNAPRMAVGEDGEVLITWYQAPVDDLMVYISERRGPDEPFSQPPADGFISPLGGPVDNHAIANPWPALHPSGAGAVVWSQQVEEWSIPIFVATRDVDGTWQRPASREDSLSRPGALARCPQAAFTPDGTLVVTWFETRDDRTEVLVWQGDPQEASVEPRVLSTPGAEAVHPALVVDADGGVMVSWGEQVGGAWQVVARRYQPYADRWLDLESLSTPFIGLAPSPRVALAPDDGRVMVAWAQGGVIDGVVHVASLP